MDSIYSPSTKNKIFGSDKPQNMTLLSQKMQGYQVSLDHSKIDFIVGDNTQFGEIVAINKLFWVKSCLVGGVWRNERDLIPVESKVIAKQVNKVNFVVGLVMSIIK